MKTLVNDFVQYLDNDEYKQRMEAYARVLKTNEWKFFRDTLWHIKGEMALEMFTPKFTSLSKEEKDAVQQAYFQVNKLLDFLAEPVQWARKKTIKHKMYDLKTKVTKPKEKEDGRK